MGLKRGRIPKKIETINAMELAILIHTQFKGHRIYKDDSPHESDCPHCVRIAGNILKKLREEDMDNLINCPYCKPHRVMYKTNEPGFDWYCEEHGWWHNSDVEEVVKEGWITEEELHKINK